MPQVEIVTYYKVVLIITRFSQLVIAIREWTLYGKWTRNKPLAYWESKQYYLGIFRPSALFVDVFKHATLPIDIGTIMQMYPFNAFYVTYGGNYKRYPSVFDLRAYSTGVSVITDSAMVH